MKNTISQYDFQRAFETQRPDNFSYNGLIALFEYFEECEESIGEEIELDVIAICCEYSEDTIENIISNYSLTEELELTDMDADERREAVLSHLSDHTQVMEIEDTTDLIYLAY